MGVRNKQRRAAKARKKARKKARGRGRPLGEQAWDRDHGPPGDDEAGPRDECLSRVDAAEAALWEAAGARLAGNADAADSYAEAALTGLRDRPDLLDSAAQRIVEELVTASWRRGWLPEDLLQTAQRNTGAAEASYLVDQIAAEHRHYPPARIHPRWHRELVDLGATRWWDSARPHLPQWARRRGIALPAAVHAVIGTIALLRSLPELPRVLPLPGTAPVSDAATERAVDPKVLARVRGLLAKAESTEFVEEAEALSAKAQELMTRHALERAVVDADEDTVPAAGALRLWLQPPYLAAKGLLVDAVAAANRCRSVLYEKLGFVTVLGDEVDLEIVELLTTSLLVQASRSMLAGGRRSDRRGQSRTRSYRQAFLVSYATRIRERLTAASDEAVSATGAPTLLPVLAARERVVEELFDSMFPALVHRSCSVSNAEGWHAGRAAADLAILDAHRSLSAG